mgnify:CR=1 FL=1
MTVDKAVFEGLNDVYGMGLDIHAVINVYRVLALLREEARVHFNERV